MLALSSTQLQEVKTILACHTAGRGVLAFGSRVSRAPQPAVKPFADLDLALTGLPLAATEMYLLRDAMSQSQLPFRVDICHWSDLPDSWKSQLVTEVLQ